MRRAPVLLVLALLLGGCWADADDDPVVAGDDPTEQAEADDPTTTPTGTRPDPEAEGPVATPSGAPTAEELAPILPTMDELPTEVAERHDSELRERDDVADPICGWGWPGNLVTDMASEVDVGGVSAFYGPPEEDRSGEPPPSYLIALASLPDAGGLVADARQQLETCADRGPHEEEASIDEILDWPPVGDASVASLRTSTLALYQGGPVPDGRSTLVLAAVDDVVILVTVMIFSAGETPATEVPPQDIQELVASLVEQVDALR